MNGFNKHQIKHSSASQINQFANAPCAWVAKYLCGAKFSGSIAMTVGIEVEQAVVNIISGGFSFEDSIKGMNKQINKASGLGLTITDAERKRIAGACGMVEQAVEYLKQFGEPEFDGNIIDGLKQKEVSLNCVTEEWTLPIKGYLDFYYPKLGKIIDLKTTMAAPSNMSLEHMRQGSLYKGANDNYAVEFVYVTPKKMVSHTIDDHRPILAECKQILIRQEKLLRLDKEQIIDIIPVIAGSYYWSGSEDIRKELYGI